jgi:hypothetical protein
MGPLRLGHLGSGRMSGCEDHIRSLGAAHRLSKFHPANTASPVATTKTLEEVATAKQRRTRRGSARSFMKAAMQAFPS